MDRRSPVNRRLERSTRVTVAVVLLVGASVAVLAAVWSGEQPLLAGASILALGCGWTALRLTWTAVLHTRYENAVDRTELAQTYRELFASRSVEHHGFVSGMSQRLAARDDLVAQLEGDMAVTQLRAVEAEASVRVFKVRLDDAESRLVILEQHLAHPNANPNTGPDAGAGAGADESALDDPEDDTEPTLRIQVVPEWANLETDPTAALLAWEQHANALSGRHSAVERPAGNG